MQSLLEILSEQAIFGFSGRINIIKSQNRQYLGAISQRDGMIVDAQYNGLRSKKALFSALFDDLEGYGHKYVVEPEIVEASSVVFELSVKDLKESLSSQYELYTVAKKLKPAPGIKLLIESEFIIKGENVSSDEFQVLSALCEFSRADDIYKNVGLMEYEVTNALVSLRKKKALKVIR